MKRNFKFIILLLSIVFLTACSGEESETFAYTALENMERLDAPVNIPKDVVFTNMNEEAKEQIYATLDQIGTHAAGTQVPENYSNIEEIASEQAYIDLLLATQDQAVIVYLGFDECPWCKSFSPKLNQFAMEFDVLVYYYNTQVRDKDATFAGSMETYNVETVPYAFIVSNGEPQERINHHSSMQEIENFVTLYVEEYLND